MRTALGIYGSILKVEISKKSFIIICSVLSVFIVGMGFIALNSQWRLSLKEKLLPKQRQILAKTQYIPQEISTPEISPQYLLLKIREGEDLFLEVFQVNEAGLPVGSLQRLELTGQQDAYFNFQGNASNLAQSDVDQDGTPEVLAPGVDLDGQFRLNIFKFDSSLKRFEALNQGMNPILPSK